MKVLHTIRETPPNPSGAQISQMYFCFFIFFGAQFFHNRMLIDFTVLLSQQHGKKTNFDTNILGTETSLCDMHEDVEAHGSYWVQ